MKVLSKITLGVVSIFSLCSCDGRGSKTTKEKFINELNDLKTNDSYKKAELTYITISKTGYGDKLGKEKKTHSGIYFKNEYGEWVSSYETFDEMADSAFKRALNSTVDKFAPSTDDSDYSNPDGAIKDKETYYINPLGYKYSLDMDLSSYTTGMPNQHHYDYYEWNDYGYLTYSEGRTEYIYRNDKSYVKTERYTMKIVYK